MKGKQNHQFVWEVSFGEKLIAMYKDGTSLNKLAMEFGTSPETIKNKLIELGIPIRGRKESQLLEVKNRYVRD